MMNLHWKHLAIALAVLPIAAILFAWIGFFNVGASTGHWKITEWFLHFAMRSAVRTYASTVEEPELLPAQGVQPAAGHFAHGCASCHGAPGERRSPTVLRMLPLPPHLPSVLPSWNDAELFQIVRHGIRFSGMPAWPVQNRDDEVWEMVAFLRQLQSLEPAGYRALAYGEAGKITSSPRGLPEILADCARCHGATGAGRSRLVPVLAGQNQLYLLESLKAYAEDRRPSGIMATALAIAPNTEFEALARHFADMPPQAGIDMPSASAVLIERGREIATSGLPSQGVPACLSCHGATPINPLYPRIAGQHPDYLEAQLRLFRAGERGGTPFNHLMVRVAKGLSDEDIGALTAFFATAPTNLPNEASQNDE